MIVSVVCAGCNKLNSNVISFEVTNSLTRMIKKKGIDREKAINLVKSFQKIPIKLFENNLESVLEIAWDYKIYAYDAFFLDTAKSLNLPLLTFDDEMKTIGKELGINIIGG